jgi:hypothetical protein
MTETKMDKGNRPLCALKNRREDRVKMDLQGTGCEDMKWFSWLRLGSDGGLNKYADELAGSIKAEINHWFMISLV